MNKLSKLELIKIAIEEWYSNEVKEHQALVNIATIISVREPSDEAFEWAKREIKVYG